MIQKVDGYTEQKLITSDTTSIFGNTYSGDLPDGWIARGGRVLGNPK